MGIICLTFWLFTVNFQDLFITNTLISNYRFWGFSLLIGYISSGKLMELTYMNSCILKLSSCLYIDDTSNGDSYSSPQHISPDCNKQYSSGYSNRNLLWLSYYAHTVNPNEISTVVLCFLSVLGFSTYQVASRVLFSR